MKRFAIHSDIKSAYCILTFSPLYAVILTPPTYLSRLCISECTTSLNTYSDERPPFQHSPCILPYSLFIRCPSPESPNAKSEMASFFGLNFSSCGITEPSASIYGNGSFPCIQLLNPLYIECRFGLLLFIVWSTTIMKCLLIGSFSVFAFMYNGKTISNKINFRTRIIKFYIFSKNALGIYAVTIVTYSSTTTPTLYCPCYLATFPITLLNAPSIPLPTVLSQT